MIEEKLAIWALAGIGGLGPAGIKRIIEDFGSAEMVFSSDRARLRESVLGDRLIDQLVDEKDWDEIKSRFEKSIPPGAGFMSISEESYPERLRNIADPPPFLYYRGDLSCLRGPTLAVVGSRRPTDYGQRMASRLTADLVSSGVTIVSGLAFGIDAACHQAALDNGGRTAAVFACGLDYIYPPGHASLASKIEGTGCLLSEFPKGTRPERYNFPVRNRIISGLAHGVVVVEAAARSGALVTARLGLEQDREVFAVPGRADSELSSGANDLIKQGATPVTSADDIISSFGWQKSKKSFVENLDLSKLHGAERSLFDILSIQPIHVDELGRKSGLGPARTSELLLNLEIKGFIIRKPGNYVVRA